MSLIACSATPALYSACTGVAGSAYAPIATASGVASVAGGGCVMDGSPISAVSCTSSLYSISKGAATSEADPEEAPIESLK